MAYIQRGALMEGILHCEFRGATCKGLFWNFLVINCYFIIAVTPEKSPKDYSHLKFGFPP